MKYSIQANKKKERKNNLNKLIIMYKNNTP